MNTPLESNNSHRSGESAAQDTISTQFHELFEGVEDLIKRVAEVESPELQKIRAKARAALIVARSAVQDGAVHVGKQARWAAEATDGIRGSIPGTRSGSSPCSASGRVFWSRAEEIEPDTPGPLSRTPARDSSYSDCPGTANTTEAQRVMSYLHEARRKKASRDCRSVCLPRRARHWVRRALRHPPSRRGAASARDTVETARSSDRTPNGQESARLQSARLDLRAPVDFPAARVAANSGSEPWASGSVAFPSARRASSKSEPLEADSSLASSGLGNTGFALKNTSRAQELTSRFHREGLPLARLWETRSAMLSLGLSPRGKPEFG